MKRFTKLQWLLILIIVAFILSLVAYYEYKSETDQIRKEKFAYLEAVANLKVDQITRWRSERLSEAEFFPSRDNVKKAVIALSNNKNDAYSLRYLDETLRPIQQRHSYQNIFITDLKNKVLFSLDKQLKSVDIASINIIHQSVIKDTILFSDFYYCKTHSVIHLDIISPIKNNDGKPIGILVFRFDPDVYLYPLIQKWPTPSNSGECTILSEEESLIRVLSDVRFRKNAALNLTIPKNDTGYVSVKAFRSHRGVLDGFDYRRVEVLAAVRKISGSKWYLVSKIDKDEIFEDLNYKIGAIILVTVVAFLLFSVLIMFLYKNRQSQVYKDLFIKQKQLSDNQAQTKAITDAAQDAIIMIDENGNITFWNPAAEKIFGYLFDEVKDKNLHSLLAPPSFHSDHHDAFEKFRHTGKGNAIGNILEFIAIKKDGKEFSVELSLSALQVNNKWQSVGIIRDISERKIVEIKLKNSEERFRKAFYTSPDSININRLNDGLYISVNDGFQQMTGYTEGEVIGKTSLEINIWNDPEDRKRLVKGLTEDGIVQNLEAQFRTKNGSIIYGLMSASIIKLNNEQHILSITRDITERKKIEQERIESEKNYHQIIEGMKDSVFVIGFDGKIIDVNKAAMDMLGYSKEEFSRLTPIDFDDSLTDLQIQNLIEKMPVDKLQSFQTTHISKSKKRIPVEITSTLIKYKGEDAILSIARDITQWINAQQSIYKSESLLNETQRLAKVGGWEWDIENNKMYWTDECFRIHGINPAEIEGDPEKYISKSIGCYNDADKPIVLLTFNKCVQEGIPYDLEFQFTNFENKKLWIRTIAEPVYVENKIVRVIGNIIDVTERVDIMDKLRRSEKRFRELFESMEEGFFLAQLVYDENEKPVDWRFLDVNPAHGKIMNLPRHKVIGKTAYELFPDLEKLWFDAQVEVALTGVPRTIEGFVSATGRYYVNHLYSSRQGQFACIFSDITERKLAEEKLKESEERYRRIVNTANEGIWMMNAEHKTTYVNSRMCNMLGYEESEILDKKVEDFMLPEDLPAHYQRMNQRYKGESSTYEHRFIKKDGTIIHTIVSGVSLKNKEGNFVGSFGMFTDISIRKKAEEALRKSEERWMFAIEGSDDGVWDWNINTGEVFFSTRWKSMLGYNDEEIKSEQREWESRIHPEDLEEVLTILREHLDGKTEFYSSEHRILCKDGTYKWILDRGKVLVKNNDGSPARIVGTHKDITERRYAEQALMESEERFRSIVEGAPDAIFIQVDQKFVFANSQLHMMLGYNSSDELRGKLILDHIHPEYRDLVSRRINRLNLDHRPVNELREIKFLKVDGTEIWVETKGEPIVYNNINGALVFVRDVSERKKAEEALKNSESKFYSLFENSPNAIIISDPETYKILDCNQNACKMNGFSRDELIGQSLNILHPVEMSSDFVKPEIREQNIKVLKERKSITVETLHKKKDGTVFPIESSISLITLNGKDVTMGIDRDITERKAIEKELEVHRNNLEELVKVRTKEIDWINKELISEIEKKRQTEILLQQSLDKEKELNQLKSRFISTASHEFRTPLTTILSSAELIQRYGKKWEEEKYSDHLNRITNSVEYLTNLMDDVLTISRIESGRINFTPAEADLKELCEKVIMDIKLTDNNKHNLVFNFISSETRFLIDQKQMQIIIQNLLSNSVKYSNDGCKIELSVQTSEDTLHIKVSDNGYGISEDDLPHLFEPFYRSLNTESIQGTGLGLTIVKNAVEMHGGTISVNSKLGKSTTFIVNIPRNRQ